MWEKALPRWSGSTASPGRPAQRAEAVGQEHGRGGRGGLKAEIERINRDLPQLQPLTIITDTSKYIKQSISNVTDSAVQGGILAILILLLFLGDLRSTLIIGTSIPISIIATFVLMYFNGFTLNIMSLGGVALGIGMLVDNAIVVLENIFRWRELGDGTPEKSADRSHRGGGDADHRQHRDHGRRLFCPCSSSRA